MAANTNYPVQEAFADLVGSEGDRNELRKLLSGLHANYSRILITTALEKESSIVIPVEAGEELYFLNQLVRVLDGTYQFNYIPGTLEQAKSKESKV